MPTADELIGPPVVRALAACLATAAGRALPAAAGRAGPAAAGRACPAVAGAADALGGLPYSARVARVRDAVLADLPQDYPAFEQVLRAALADPAFTGWMVMPVVEAVAVRGIGVFEPALELLALLTPRLTSESAVRPFLAADLGRALAVMAPWAGHPDEHVRRLLSEGTRPRLPWAPVLRALVADPAPVLPVLDALYRDGSEYVRRSVANHLNDISRDHPAVAVAAARRWLAAPDANTARTVRHGLRTLVKAGHPDALGLLGFDGALEVAASVRVAAEVVDLGGHLEFAFEVAHAGPGPAAVAVDYLVHHVRGNGTRVPKVFKLSTRTLAPGEVWRGTRRHPITPISTRRYYAGRHRVELQVNGRVRGGADFWLRTEGPARGGGQHHS